MRRSLSPGIFHIDRDQLPVISPVSRFQRVASSVLHNQIDCPKRDRRHELIAHHHAPRDIFFGKAIAQNAPKPSVAHILFVKDNSQ
jgi:hypothetical protein